MKKLHTFITAVIILIPMWAMAQIESLSFKKSMADYQPIEGGVSLTADFTEEDWELYYLDLELEQPVRIPAVGGEYLFDLVEIGFDGFMYLDGIHTNTFERIDFILAPMDEILDYRFTGGVMDDDSEIIYLFQDGISHFEYRNLSFWGDEFNSASPNARFSFFVSIRHEDGQITYHYGPNRYDPVVHEFFNEIPLYIGLGFDSYNEDGFSLYGVLAGESTNPGFVTFEDADDLEEMIGLLDIPSEGTVYQFNFGLSTPIQENSQPLTLKIAPNPGSNSVQLIGDLFKDTTLDIYFSDAMGRIVLQDKLHNTLQINTTPLLPGMYYIKVISEKGSTVLPWLKH